MADAHAEATKVVSPRDVVFKMKIEYSRGVKDHAVKNLEAYCDMCNRLGRPDFDLNAFCKGAADLVSKLFAIDSIGICLRGDDGLYRYVALSGIDDKGMKEFDSIAYREDQLLDPSIYPSYEISSNTRLFLTEDHPYAQSEEGTYRRPALIGMKRRTVVDSLEADYLDFFFHDQAGRIAGYIESSGTRLKKLPDAETIRWLELLASLLGVAYQISHSRR